MQNVSNILILVCFSVLTSCFKEPHEIAGYESQSRNQEVLQEDLGSNCRVTLKGIFVNVSTVMPLPGCVKILSINALSTIYIDHDIDAVGFELDLILVAPILYIDGKRLINLDGRPGTPYPIGEAVGKNGAPGRAGQNSGNMLGIGLEYYGMEDLVVSLNGGKGGPGQGGGEGDDSPKVQNAYLPRVNFSNF